jgi:hypothetical protein
VVWPRLPSALRLLLLLRLRSAPRLLRLRLGWVGLYQLLRQPSEEEAAAACKRSGLRLLRQRSGLGGVQHLLFQRSGPRLLRLLRLRSGLGGVQHLLRQRSGPRLQLLRQRSEPRLGPSEEVVVVCKLSGLRLLRLLRLLSGLGGVQHLLRQHLGPRLQLLRQRSEPRLGPSEEEEAAVL